MNKIYGIITILSSLFCSAQIQNGSIEYGIISHMPIPKNDDGYFSELAKKLSVSDTLANLSLHFNTKESYFFLNPIILTEFQDTNEFTNIMMVKPKYYTSISDSIHKYYENDPTIGEYAIAAEKKAKWTLTQETKMIGGYLCYKATSPFYNLETWFDDNHKLDITAWYTTKIPVNFGPNGYHGLPGLILELQTRMATIYVKKINLNTTPTPVINKLDSYKLLTIGQRNMLLDKKFSPEMRRFIEDTEKQKNETIEKMKAEKK